MATLDDSISHVNYHETGHWRALITSFLTDTPNRNFRRCRILPASESGTPSRDSRCRAGGGTWLSQSVARGEDAKADAPLRQQPEE